VSSELTAPEPKPLVLDANILVRAVLGRRVLSLLEAYAGRVSFHEPVRIMPEAGNVEPRVALRLRRATIEFEAAYLTRW